MLLKELSYGYKKNLYYILIPLILVLFMNNSKIEPQNLLMNFYENHKEVEYNVSILPSNISGIRNIFQGYLLIIVFIGYFVPYRSLYNEALLLKYILITPIQNQMVIRIKYLSGFLLLCLFTLLYGYKINLVLTETIILLLIGCLFIALGLLFGIFANIKGISIICYTLIFLFLLSPRIFLHYYNVFLSSLENIFSNSIKSVLTIFILIIMNVLCEYLLEVVWRFKNRRDLI